MGVMIVEKQNQSRTYPAPFHFGGAAQTPGSPLCSDQRAIDRGGGVAVVDQQPSASARHQGDAGRRQGWLGAGDRPVGADLRTHGHDMSAR